MVSGNHSLVNEYLSGSFRFWARPNLFTLIVPLAIDFLFIWLDQKELLYAEMLTESWMYMAILLVPLYLLIKEIKTNHHYSPIIIWCFLFALGFIL